MPTIYTIKRGNDHNVREQIGEGLTELSDRIDLLETFNGAYLYDSSLTPTPAVGYVSLDNADPALVTFLYISTLTQNGTDATPYLSAIIDADIVTIGDTGTGDTYQYETTAIASIAAGVATVPVTNLSTTSPTQPADQATLQVTIADAGNMKLNSGNAGTSFPDGQIMTGEQYYADEVTQRSNLIWAQDINLVNYGGFMVYDYDFASPSPPTDENLVAIFGLGESPTRAGQKQVGLAFNQPTHNPFIGTLYDGPCQFQKLNLTYTAAGPEFHFPILDGAAGSTLTTDGDGGLYWTEPANPPELIQDTDITDYAVSQVGNLAPVSVTATRPGIPAQVSFECTFFTASNNRAVLVEMLVNGVRQGQIYDVPLPRNADVAVHHTWSPVLNLGTETITIQHIANGTDVNVLGSVAETKLDLLLPAGVALRQQADNTYIIDSFAFFSRFLDSEKEAWNKGMNGEKWQPGPPPDDLTQFILKALFARAATHNVNLTQQHVVDGVNYLETLGILGAGRAAVILAT